eukprot:1722041-Amphidinium_carterae.1
MPLASGARCLNCAMKVICCPQKRLVRCYHIVSRIVSAKADAVRGGSPGGAHEVDQLQTSQSTGNCLTVNDAISWGV